MRPTKRRAGAVRDVILGPDALLRISVLPNPQGTEIELGVWRASPADHSADRFRRTSEVIRVPIAKYKALTAALAAVGVAASEVEFWRPYPHERDVA